jgi:hypothetical protein
MSSDVVRPKSGVHTEIDKKPDARLRMLTLVSGLKLWQLWLSFPFSFLT